MDVRISGVYHSSIIAHLNQLGIDQFSFDLRPKSLNFTQAYKIKEILDQFQGGLNQYFLTFENEKDFMVKEILLDISKADGNCFLEFTGKEDIAFCESFQTPYILKYHEDLNLQSLTQAQHLQSLSFDQLYIERLLQFGQLYELLGKIVDPQKGGVKNLQINAQWDGSLMETLIDFYPITSLNYEISNKVEKSYRQIDLQLVQGHIEHTKKFLNL